MRGLDLALFGNGRRNGSARTWPMDRFFFARLDARALPRAPRARRRALGYLFEETLPLSIEEVQAAYQRLEDGAVLACGVEKERLAREVEPHVLSLAPDALPGFLDAATPPETLNVLTGEFEPLPLRRSRARRRLGLLLAGLCCSSLALVGLERRIDALKEGTEVLRARQGEILDELLGPAPDGALEGQRRAQLTGELRRLERTRSTGGGLQLKNAAVSLAALLLSWPEAVVARVEAVTVSEQSLTVRGTAETSAEAQSLADHLGKVEGWSVEQPQFSTSGNVTRFTIRLRPAPGRTS